MSALIGQVRLSQKELHQLKWLLGNILSLIALWALFQANGSNSIVLLALTVVIGVVTVVPRLVGLLPESFWKALTPIILIVIVADFFYHGFEFLEPMLRMVMILTAVRAGQYRRRREDLQLLLLCLFILVVIGALTVSLLFAFQMILFTPLAMILLFIVNILEPSHERMLNLEDWKEFSWSHFVKRIWAALDIRLLIFATGAFASVVTVSSLIFVLIPRFRMDQALPFIQMQAFGKKGFSDKIKFGDVNELADDNQVALRVEVPDRSRVPNRPYWRMVVLDEYYNGTFRFSTAARGTGLEPRERNEYLSTGIHSFEGANNDKWVFYLEGSVSRFLPFLGNYDVVHFSKKAKFTGFPVFNLLELSMVNSNVFGYSVTGIQPSDRVFATDVEAQALKFATPEIPELNDTGYPKPVNYPYTTLMLPVDASDRAYLEEVVAEITGGKQLSLQQFTANATAYLEKQYDYDTSHAELSAKKSDPLLKWMREAETGWCEHFTGAYIMLARTAGFPARAVAGFAGASWNEFEGYLIVRNSHAHAWVEVYDRYSRKWQRVDPTPAAREGEGFSGNAFAASVSTESGWDAWVDSLRMVWYRRIVNFDQVDQVELASNMKAFSKAFVTALKARIEGYFTAAKEWLLGGWDSSKFFNAAWVLLLFVGSVLLAYVLKTRMGHLWFKIREARGKEMLLAPMRKKAGAMLVKFKPVYETINWAQYPEEFNTWKGVYQALLSLRYGETAGQNPRSVFKEARVLLKSSKRLLG